jgi:hypothetical protein
LGHGCAFAPESGASIVDGLGRRFYHGGGLLTGWCESLVIVGSVNFLSACSPGICKPVERGLAVFGVSGGSRAGYFNEPHGNKFADRPRNQVNGNTVFLKIAVGADKPPIFTTLVASQFYHEAPEGMAGGV